MLLHGPDLCQQNNAGVHVAHCQLSGFHELCERMCVHAEDGIKKLACLLLKALETGSWLSMQKLCYLKYTGNGARWRGSPLNMQRWGGCL